MPDLNKIKNKVKHNYRFVNGRYCRSQAGAASLEVWDGEKWVWMTFAEIEALPKKKIA